MLYSKKNTGSLKEKRRLLMGKKDTVDGQDRIRLCCNNLLKIKTNKTERRFDLVTEVNEINVKIKLMMVDNKEYSVLRKRLADVYEEIALVVLDIVDLEAEMSILRRSCKNPKHDSEDGCPDCGSPF